MKKALKICLLKISNSVVKFFRCRWIMTLDRKEVPANFVPAAAVIRKGRTLLGMIGRKEFVGGFVSYLLNVWFIT